VKFNLLHSLTAGNAATANVGNKTGGTTAQATQAPKPTAQAPKPTVQATQAPKPTMQPTQPPATHTGTVVGTTALAANSSKVFTNPKDGAGSLLIHGSNGAFVAFESACTHEGVTVHYDTGTMTIVCPAHGSIFNAATGQVIQGPAAQPLPAVAIKVNADGTITV
jgi:Rieske Fe-S protein